MTDVERTIRDCMDLFVDDLTELVLQAVDEQVARALEVAVGRTTSPAGARGRASKASAPKGRASQAKGTRKKRAATESKRRGRPSLKANAADAAPKARGRAQAATKRGATKRGAAKRGAGKRGTGKQLALTVTEETGLNLELPFGELSVGSAGKKRRGRPRKVRKDSMLGAELEAHAETSQPAAPEAAEEKKEEKRVTMPPLFVHRRARDGSVHAIPRGTDSSQPSA